MVVILSGEILCLKLYSSLSGLLKSSFFYAQRHRSLVRGIRTPVRLVRFGWSDDSARPFGFGHTSTSSGI